MSTFGKIGARDLLYGKGVPRGYTEHDALIMTLERDYKTYINTGIKVPSSGDFLVEIDSMYGRADSYVYYTACGGVGKDSTSANGFAVFCVLSYKGIYFSTNHTQIATFPVARVPSKPFSMRFGILSNKMAIECMSDEFPTVTKTFDLNGTERGGQNDTFMWGLLRNGWDNTKGTRIGTCRLYSNGKVVWDGIPCSRNSDGAVGYWDIVSRRFFPANAGFAVYDKVGGGRGKCIELSESAFYAYSSDSFWKEAA